MDRTFLSLPRIALRLQSSVTAVLALLLAGCLLSLLAAFDTAGFLFVPFFSHCGILPHMAPACSASINKARAATLIINQG